MSVDSRIRHIRSVIDAHFMAAKVMLQLHFEIFKIMKKTLKIISPQPHTKLPHPKHLRGHTIECSLEPSFSQPLPEWPRPLLRPCCQDFIVRRFRILFGLRALELVLCKFALLLLSHSRSLLRS
jgi:hypothetical protein